MQNGQNGLIIKLEFFSCPFIKSFEQSETGQRKNAQSFRKRAKGFSSGAANCQTNKIVPAAGGDVFPLLFVFKNSTC
jgi:hypothetical protein